MPNKIQEAKAALRKEMRARLTKLSLEARAAAGAKLCERLQDGEIWRSAKSVLLFAPLTGELDVWPLVQAGLAAEKIVGLPRFESTRAGYVAAQVGDLGRDIVTGKFQIREPSASCPELALAGFDLILVPGVAFDLRGRRLGRGRGFYDRLLTEVRGVKCGAAFDEQIVASVPAEVHDAAVNCVVTPSQWVKIAD